MRENLYLKMVKDFRPKPGQHGFWRKDIRDDRMVCYVRLMDFPRGHLPKVMFRKEPDGTLTRLDRVKGYWDPEDQCFDENEMTHTREQLPKPGSWSLYVNYHPVEKPKAYYSWGEKYFFIQKEEVWVSYVFSKKKEKPDKILKDKERDMVLWPSWEIIKNL